MRAANLARVKVFIMTVDSTLKILAGEGKAPPRDASGCLHIGIDEVHNVMKDSLHAIAAHAATLPTTGEPWQGISDGGHPSETAVA